MKDIFKFIPHPIQPFSLKEPMLPLKSGITEDDILSDSLEKNVTRFKEIFHFGLTSDFQIKEMEIHLNQQTYPAAILFFDGLTDTQMISTTLLNPLTKENFYPSSSVLKTLPSQELENALVKHILIQSQVKVISHTKEIITRINHGECALIVDSLAHAILCDVKKIPSRAVNKSENEMTIIGPSESFIEQLRTNTALIRKFIKDENLIFENLTIGAKSKTNCVISYLTNVTNDSLINEVKRRISSIDIDFIIDIGELAQLIEDKTFLLDPLILSTERPDKVASSITEGRVAILLEGSPNVLIVPAIFSDFTHSPEDTYLRHPYAMLLRFFRIPAILLSIFLPGIYIAITTFHQEMIPTDLLLAIAGTREKVPFPMLIELLIMETSFEIIREASIRTPAPVGPTLGIVGTLILGQAIVSASIVSPVLVIIVALTGISAFAIANFSLSYSFRIARFYYIFLGGFFGFFGIALGLFIHMIILSNVSSFGVPYLTPFTPFRKGAFKDDLFIAPLWKQEKRPIFLKPKEQNREPKITRKWMKS